MESSSDEDFVPDFEDYDSDDDLSEESEDDEEISDTEAREMEGGWRLIADIFNDSREDPLPEYMSNQCGIRAAHEHQFTSASGAFKQFLDKDIIGKLCEWANKRATMFFTEHPEKMGKVNSVKWKRVTENDMYSFIALLITMGLVKLPVMAQYWRKDWLVCGPPVFCKEVMSRDRFFSILKFLRFSPPENVEKNKPQTRIEPFLSMLRDKCKAILEPGKHVAVDEALVLWKGRLGFRQYIKSKRARFGLKIFVLCPSDPNWQGFSWNFELYYGKNSYQFDDPGAEILSKSEKIVVYMMSGLLDEGRHVVTDNWYTSLRLATYLEDRNTTITGVVRSGRGPPREISQLPLEKHQAIFARKGNVLIVRWEDKKDITVLTTKYKADMVERVREHFGHQPVFYNKPLHIDKYNKMMGSVDKADQFLEPYASERKSLAWFKKLGIHFFLRIALNAYLAWKNKTNSTAGFMPFLETVARELLLEHNPGASVFSKKEEKKKATITSHHFVKWEKIGKRKRCRMCHPVRRDTPYFCPACPEKPGLCSMKHFNEWHDQEGVPQSEARQQGAERVTTARQVSKDGNEAATPSTSEATPTTPTPTSRDPSPTSRDPTPTSRDHPSTSRDPAPSTSDNRPERITKRKSTRARGKTSTKRRKE